MMERAKWVLPAPRSPCSRITSPADKRGAGELWHADLYRLSNLDEVVELGLEDAFETGICLVEWPDRLAEATPRNALTMHLEMTETPGVRIMTLQFSDPRWSDILTLPDE